MHGLGNIEKAGLLRRFAANYSVKFLDYGTVRDYCDSCDHLPSLSLAQNDLKDLQRPWTVKAALGLLPIGSRVLEIGAGQPLVAGLLADLGYDVTIVDPYDGSGQGPTAFAEFVEAYPNVRIIRDQFRSGMPQLKDEVFDGIYSVSVLEHVSEPALGALFEGVSEHLQRSGHSFHSIDCVVEGPGTVFHFEQCFKIIKYQRQLSSKSPLPSTQLADVLLQATRDLETFYLSPAGHNLWRAGAAYDTFPFRKVISLQTAIGVRRL